ncbi:MAG TPA: NYN domain-containing protein [Candidatus Eisenbacteria bacterium]|nr:NYN domain-containing protein [Candidatus Eisenbacteria bacterium]
MSKNVAVFVDVANIFYAAKAAGVDIDYVTLLKAGSAGRDLVRAYAYTGLDPDNENQRNFHEFLRRHGYKVVSKDIRKYGDGKVKANLDIELVVDMMKTARNLDIAIVVSGDGDFAPAIRAVQEMGVRVEVISFRGNTSSDLIEVADQFTEITQLAKVEKGSSRSGRRVADDEDDLSMTEVPEKQSEGLGDRRRGRGRGRAVPAEPVAAAPRARVQRAGRTPVPAVAMGDAALVVLPGEKLSRAAAIAPAALPIADEALEAADDDDGTLSTDESGAPLSEEGQRRRRRRRGGRGRGRGRGRDEGLLEGETPATAATAASSTAEDAEEIEELGPVVPAPRRSGFSFGSVWDSQIGIPPAAAAGSTPAPLAPLADDEDLDEPPIPEYLIAERRQRDARSGRGGGGGVRGHAGSYAAAMDRERYGGGRGTPSRFAEQAPRDRGPVRLDRPPNRPPMRPVDRPAPRAGSEAEPWSEVPPEIEAMLRAQLGSQPARPARREPPPAAATAESASPARPPASIAAPAPRRRAPRQPAVEVPAGTETPTAASASAGPTGEDTAAAPATRRRSVRAPAADGRKASASTAAGGSGEGPAGSDVAAAPKRRAVRRTPASVDTSTGGATASAAGPETVAATDEAATPKRRVTRKKAEPTA